MVRPKCLSVSHLQNPTSSSRAYRASPRTGPTLTRTMPCRQEVETRSTGGVGQKTQTPASRGSAAPFCLRVTRPPQNGGCCCCALLLFCCLVNIKTQSPAWTFPTRERVGWILDMSAAGPDTLFSVRTRLHGSAADEYPVVNKGMQGLLLCNNTHVQRTVPAEQTDILLARCPKYIYIYTKM
jgi:hypothetical protein